MAEKATSEGLIGSDMTEGAKRIVAAGYDEIAEAYLRWSATSLLREHWLDALIALLPTGARVLDLGCGAGIPVACRLADHGYDVTGVDGSHRQIELARHNEQRATFVTADMTAVEFERQSFDAVTAFYSITHIPRDEHSALLQKIRTWLKPGGLLLASLGAEDSPDWSGDWLGTTMFFSHFDATTNRVLVEAAGLNIERSEVVGEMEDDKLVRFLWVIARRPLA